MRILYLIKSFALKAGVERVMSDKMNYLSEHHWDITLVTYEQGNHPQAFPLRPEIKCYDLDTRFFTLGKYNLLARAFAYYRMRSTFRHRLQKVVNEVQPDMLIMTTYSLKVADLVLKVKTPAKRIIESHITCYSVRKDMDLGHHLLLKFVGRFIDGYFFGKIKRFDTLIALTSGDANEWKEYTRNVIVIPNPLTLYPQSLKVSSQPEQHRIICAGRLSPQKGYDLLVPAFKRIAEKCPDWHIDIYGTGSELDRLNVLISNASLEGRIIINQPSSQIYEEYMRSDFLVFCSRYEGYGLVLNEAMSCGLPCVSFRCKYGPEDIITDGKNGILVEAESIEELASAMLWMIQHPDERAKMGVCARESAAKYTKEMIMPIWEELFKSLLK